MGVTNKRTLTKTRRRLRDIDQVKADILSPNHLTHFIKTKAAEDLPGLGRFYCVPCAKWYETEHALVSHRRGKPHKRRLRQLRNEPHSQAAAEAAIGCGSYEAPVTNNKTKTEYEIAEAAATAAATSTAAEVPAEAKETDIDMS